MRDCGGGFIHKWFGILEVCDVIPGSMTEK